MNPILPGLAGVALVAASAAAPASATVFTSSQAARDGLQAMRELNVITFGDLGGASHVQGKGFVGGSLTGNNTFGQGNGGVGAAASARPTLAVARDVTAGVTLQNGANGAAGAVAATPQVDVGRNVSGTANTNPDGWRVRVGGNLAGFQNVNGGPAISYGGSYGGSANARVVRDPTIAAGGSADLGAALGREGATLVTNLGQLSAGLATLSTNGRLVANGSALTFDFSGLAAGAAYGAYTIGAAALFSYGALDIVPGMAGGAVRPVVINVTGGGAYTSQLNMNLADAVAQAVIFNFVDATGLDLRANFTGSLLAPQAAVTNSANITGSLVARTATLGAEVHLGTYAGPSAIVPAAAAVPEPGIWATMLGGFGLIGLALRRQMRAALA